VNSQSRRPVAEAASLRRATELLCDPSLAEIVDLVCRRDDRGGGDVGIVVENSAGAVRLHPDGHEVLRGRDPLAGDDPMAFVPLAAELADPSPPNERNHYPLAAERLGSLFAAPAAPDLAVVHTGRHHWPELGGHIGEHGSLNVIQSRAPMLLSGAGVAERGVLPRWARVVDVAPTLAHLVGSDVPATAYDGTPLRDLVEPTGGPVIGLLWDGCNANSLYAMAAAGELPNVARLLANGCALAGGAIAEFPSVTLVNHTSALTGVGPGRHGIVNNAFFDRATGAQRLTNDARTWHRWAEWLAPGVQTVFEQVDVTTACVDEPADSGADYSTFALIRATDSGSSAGGGAAAMDALLPDPTADPLATQEWVRTRKDYAWSSSVDAVGLTQLLDLFADGTAVPRLTWWNTLLTDTGHHAGGPHSQVARDAMADADRRLGVFLDHLERVGLMSSATIMLTADHGSEGADPECVGNWDDVLRGEGLEFRDEAYGFIYLGHS
jgi:hypothetical protein